MKLNCKVSILHCYESSVDPQSRFRNTCIRLFVDRQNNDEVYFVLGNGNKKDPELKYKITDNIDAVYKRFISQGKVTIRLKNPAINIYIKGDKIQLQCFILRLKQVVEKNVSTLPSLSLAEGGSHSTPVLPKVKLRIESKNSYNMLQLLPRTLQELTMNNIHFKSIDIRILKLQNLKILNLNDNSIESLPNEVGLLPLAELHLRNNSLGLNPFAHCWRWMAGRTLSTSLKLLDLKNNKLYTIPFYLKRLKHLVTLILDNNSITDLTNGICHMRELRYLHLSHNSLKWLPMVFRAGRFHTSDISHNAFESTLPIQKHIPEDFCVVRSLVELSAIKIADLRSVKDLGASPHIEDEIVDNLSQCICRKWSLVNKPIGYIRLETKSSLPNVSLTEGINTNFRFNYCSYTCYIRYVWCVR